MHLSKKQQGRIRFFENVVSPLKNICTINLFFKKGQVHNMKDFNLREGGNKERKELKKICKKIDKRIMEKLFSELSTQTQRELGDKLGYSENVIKNLSRGENGIKKKSNCKILLLTNLAELTGTDFLWFFGEENNTTKLTRNQIFETVNDAFNKLPNSRLRVLSNHTLSNYTDYTIEQIEKNLNVLMLLQLCNAYGCSVGELLRGKYEQRIEEHEAKKKNRNKKNDTGKS